MVSPSIPGTMKPILGSTYFALASAMACRVYRAILLGTITDPQVNNTHISFVFRVATLHQRSTFDDDNDDAAIISKPSKPGVSSNLKVNVAVEKATKVGSDYGDTFWERSPTVDDASYRV